MEQWGTAELGDKRRTRRAVAVGTRMAEQTSASLPTQMEDWGELKGAYRLLNNPEVSLEALTAPHGPSKGHFRQATLKLASMVVAPEMTPEVTWLESRPVVLMIEDNTELDFTRPKPIPGLGPVGNGSRRGLILHSTLAVNPTLRVVLGLAHIQSIIRVATPKPRPKGYRSDESKVWERSVATIGSPPTDAPDALWVHVSDRGSDIFEYMRSNVDLKKHFVARGKVNRFIGVDPYDDDSDDDTEHADQLQLLDYIRTLPPTDAAGTYTVQVPPRDGKPARKAEVNLSWAKVELAVPKYLPPEVREKGPLTVWVVRVFEPNPPPDIKPIEWILLTSLPVLTLADAKQIVAYLAPRKGHL